MLCAGKLFPWNRYDSFLTSLAYVSWMKVISGTNTSAVKTLTSVKSAESGPQKNRSHTAVAVGKYGLQLCSWQFFQRIRFPPLFLGAIWSCPPQKKKLSFLIVPTDPFPVILSTPLISCFIFGSVHFADPPWVMAFLQGPKTMPCLKVFPGWSRI